MAVLRHSLLLTVLPGDYAVCRLAPDAPAQAWMTAGTHSFLARTPAELSVMVESAQAPPDVRSETGFRLIRFEGALDFSLAGVLASVTEPLAEAGISICAVSTFDRDYVLVRQAKLDIALAALVAAGHTIRRADRA